MGLVSHGAFIIEPLDIGRVVPWRMFSQGADGHHSIPDSWLGDTELRDKLFPEPGIQRSREDRGCTLKVEVEGASFIIISLYDGYKRSTKTWLIRSRTA